MRSSLLIVAIATILAVRAEAGSQVRPDSPVVIDINQDRAMGVEKKGGVTARTDLPFAQGRAFVSLDDYLAFLQKRGATDVPWYRKVGPDVYERVARRGPGTAPQTYTRAELIARFGFDR